MGKGKDKWPILLIRLGQAVTVGLAYYFVVGIPGLTSSFVAIFVALLPFDLIVAMPSISFGLRHWRQFIRVLLPRITGTAFVLMMGLAFGLAFGLGVRFGFPAPLAGVLLVGLSYTLATRIRGNISSYVAVVGGLTVFERLLANHLGSGNLVDQMAPVVLTIAVGTFAALLAGWVVGLVMGLITRSLLPRGYKTLRSFAYELPLEMQPFREVLKMETDLALAEVNVAASCPLVDRSLRDLRLREAYKTNVLAIHRAGRDIVVPGGEEVIKPGDMVLLLVPVGRISQAANLLKGSAECG